LDAILFIALAPNLGLTSPGTVEIALARCAVDESGMAFLTRSEIALNESPPAEQKKKIHAYCRFFNFHF
jgi:hypothetical protein